MGELVQLFPVQDTHKVQAEKLQSNLLLEVSRVYDDIDLVEPNYLNQHQSKLKYHLDEIQELLEQGIELAAQN